MPLIREFAKTDASGRCCKLVLSRQDMARPFIGAARHPGGPQGGAAQRRSTTTMKDPEFLAEMKARGQEVNPVSGADLDKLVAELYATPKDVVEETKKAIGGQ